MGRRLNALKGYLTSLFKGKGVVNNDQFTITNSSTSRQRKSNKLKLPSDVLIEIFSHLEDDYKTLQSCVLVDRIWCENSVPSLWSQPFKDLTPSTIIDVYLNCLTELEKSYLVENDIIGISNRRRVPVFDYVSFLRHLSMGSLYSIVQRWTDRTQTKYSASPKRRRSSIRSLSLDWGNKEIWKAYPLLLYSAGIDTYLAQLRRLSIHYITDWSIFGYLSKYAKNIETLEVVDYSFNQAPHPEDEQNLASLISIQNNLRRLAACINLEELVIKNCSFATDEILAPLMCATFPSLCKIHIVESTYSWDNVVVSLIQNNPTHLEEVYYKPVDNQQHHTISPTIIEAVAHNCPKIIRLGVPIAKVQINHLVDILTSSECKLKSLSIFRMDRISWDDEALWRDLGGLMPVTLRHLNIWIYIGDNPMQLFLQNTTAPLETLYVRWWTHYLGYDCHLVGSYLKDKPVKISEFLRHVI
ncbi:19177_t:CDS:2 [Funneliformis geosporum]|uniref:16539_t:CDS:1 n=1 Tax=Funneliformis geosporum TaxID=1117311 RepID=A0A9W4WSV8_9GLOM|nr:19177_t:CDS:2 [Funneliformis geosporum]CAI2169748.1 16539_t:CDS:2 [Funneliformis geosporum]